MKKLKIILIGAIILLAICLIVYFRLKPVKQEANKLEGYWQINAFKVIHINDKALVSIKNDGLIQTYFNYYLKDNVIYYSQDKIDINNLSEYDYFECGIHENNIYIADVFGTTLKRITKEEYLKVVGEL